MGAWGTDVFADDNAADIRDAFQKLIADGVAGPQATDQLIAQWAPEGDAIVEPVFWLALALTQWKCGRLEDRVKAKALRVIGDGSAIRPWVNGPDERKRKAALEAARKKLESPQPATRKIRKKLPASCDWERGELIAYRLLTGDFVVLRMLDLYTDAGGSYPTCELLDWRGPRIPDAGLPDDTAVLQFSNYGRGKRFMIVSSGKRLVKDRIQRLNTKGILDEQYARVPRGQPNPTRVISWKQFDNLLGQSFGIS